MAIFWHAYGAAPVTPTEGVRLPDSAGEVTALTWREMQVVAARVLGELAPAEAVSDTVGVTTIDAPPAAAG